MKTEDVLFCLSDIRDSYITEYMENIQTKKKYLPAIKRIAAIAACLAIIILLPVSYFVFFTDANLEDPRHGNTYSFSSYDELKAILPENHVLGNITIPDNSILICMGTQIPDNRENIEGTSDVPVLYEKYFDISIRFTSQDAGRFDFRYEINLDCPVDKYCSFTGLFGLANTRIEVTEICGYEVYYSPRGVKNPTGYAAAVKIGKDILVLRTELVDEAVFFEYLNSLLATNHS